MPAMCPYTQPPRPQRCCRITRWWLFGRTSELCSSACFQPSATCEAEAEEGELAHRSLASVCSCCWELAPPAPPGPPLELDSWVLGCRSAAAPSWPACRPLQAQPVVGPGGLLPERGVHRRQRRFHALLLAAARGVPLAGRAGAGAPVSGLPPHLRGHDRGGVAAADDAVSAQGRGGLVQGRSRGRPHGWVLGHPAGCLGLLFTVHKVASCGP